MDFDDVGQVDADSMDAVHEAMNEQEDEVEYAVDDKPQRVINGLFIGSAWAEMNEAALTKAGITDILQVAQGLFPRHPLLFTYMILQVEDAPTTDLVRYFPKCFDFIDKAISKGGSVLVHCAAGVSRSATVVLGYLMARHNLSLAAALDHLKAIRPWVAPNPGFLQQLAAYEAAKCDLTDWKPWHLVWYEQQQQQEQQMAAMELVSLPQQPPQPQQWLRLPQPCDNSSKQQQQGREHAPPPQQQGCCCSQPAAALLAVNGSGGSSVSAGSSLTHASLAAGSAAGSSFCGSISGSSIRNGYNSVMGAHHPPAAAAAAAGGVVAPGIAAPAAAEP